jgi:ketosteroid isomerase-like protein
MSNQALFLSYLRHYAQKDLGAVAAMFAEDIALRDWTISVRGKSAAVNETRKNFESSGTIEIVPLDIFENRDTVAAELKILVDGTIELHVVDVITFTPNGKIQSIRAYLGRGDLQTAP